TWEEAERHLVELKQRAAAAGPSPLWKAPPAAARGKGESGRLHRQSEIKRRLRARRRAEMQRRPKTPEAAAGRKHADVQTELYLEELTDAVPEAYAQTQTDAFMDRAPSPLYVPRKSGVDAETQIYPGDLFDFEVEVEPILEVIVGMTLEQAVMEVMEEEELAALKKHQVVFPVRRSCGKRSRSFLRVAGRGPSSRS
ncbi:MAG: radial spoke protein 3-domain-containing protein, partial [Olpidium bornovanus]